jgi:hypothetical protein
MLSGMEEQVRANRKMRANTLRDRALYLECRADVVPIKPDSTGIDWRAALLNEAATARKLADELDPPQ